MFAVRRGEMAEEPGLMTEKTYSFAGAASDRPPVRARVTELSEPAVASGLSVNRNAPLALAREPVPETT